MKDFLNSIAGLLFLSAASFNSFAIGQLIWQYINEGNFILMDSIVRTFHIGSFFFVLYLIVRLIYWYLKRKGF